MTSIPEHLPYSPVIGPDGEPRTPRSIEELLAEAAAGDTSSDTETK